MKTPKRSQDRTSGVPQQRKRKGELADKELDQVAGGLRTGDDDDIDDTEVQR